MADTVVLNKTQRQGTSTSSSVLVAARVGQTVEVRGDLDAGTLSDPAATVKISLEYSDDEGRNWRGIVAAEWHGGRQNRQGNWQAPRASVTLTQAGLIRAWCDNPVRRRCGLTIRVTP